MPKVSIIIATHSRPHLLPQAIKSAFKAGADVEVIVVDDASTDETSEVCRNIDRIKYIRIETNQRTAGARNVGILASSSPYIGFLDDDDVRLPGTIDEQLEIFNSSPEIGLVYGKCWLGDENLNPVKGIIPDECFGGDVFWKLLSGNFVPCLTAVFRKECLFKVGLLDKSLVGIDDYDLWLRIAEFYKFGYLDKPVAIWKQPTPVSNQGSSSKYVEALATQNLVKKSLYLKRIKDEPARHKQILKNARLRAFDQLTWGAAENLKYNRKAAARKSLYKAMTIEPIKFLRPGYIKLFLLSLFPKLTFK